MKILILNCGSSSIKYQLFDMANNADVLAKGIVERVGLNNGELKHKGKNKETFKFTKEIPDHLSGIHLILDALKHPHHGVIKDESEITAVGHRVVHGAEKFSGSVYITQEIIDKMEECVELAPLHNPANLKGIYAMKDLLPEVPQCGVFDTAFHHTMPDYAYMYGLPYEMYEKHKIRRYGFHGTSHRFVSRKACEILGVDYHTQKIITCHLGNGASIAAIKNGESVDTSMGLTPVEGLIMGTRSGDLDLGAFMYMLSKENIDAKKGYSIVNKQSGMLGLTGISYDMRDIHDGVTNGNKRCKLALDMYNYRVRKYIGSYAAAMDGVDIIVFTGGIGENDDIVRANVSEHLSFLGVDFDFEKNTGLRETDMILTKEGSKAKVIVVTTNEELIIAMDTEKILAEMKAAV